MRGSSVAALMMAISVVLWCFCVVYRKYTNLRKKLSTAQSNGPEHWITIPSNALTFSALYPDLQPTLRPPPSYKKATSSSLCYIDKCAAVPKPCMAVSPQPRPVAPGSCNSKYHHALESQDRTCKMSDAEM